MKCYFTATIAIYFLFMFLFMDLFTHASQEKKSSQIILSIEPVMMSKLHNKNNSHNNDKRINKYTFSQVLKQKCKKLSTLLRRHKTNKVCKDLLPAQNDLQQSSTNVVHEIQSVQFIKNPKVLVFFQKRRHIFQNSFLNATNNNILSLIFNHFLTIQDILLLRKTCKHFEILLQPNHAKMVTFSNYANSRKITEEILEWCDLKYFLNQNYDNGFDKMEMFIIKENQFAVLTNTFNKQIIVWENNLGGAHYRSMLLKKLRNKSATAGIIFPEEDDDYNDQLNEDDYNSDQKHFDYNNDCGLFKIRNKQENAWAQIKKNGNVETGGKKHDGGDSSKIQSKLKNVKIIVATLSAFAALLENGNVVAWGDKDLGGKIPETLKLQNVTTIISNTYAFATIVNNGFVFAWGEPSNGGKIPKKIQTKLKNVKLIFASDSAFSVLLHNGRVLAWGSPWHGGQIPIDIQIALQKNVVKMIFSTASSFAALLHNGFVFAWGDEEYGGRIPINYYYIPRSISFPPHLQNVKMISSTYFSFAALLNNGRVIAWGDEEDGGEIPNDIQLELNNNNVQIILSTCFAFAALLQNGRVIAWGSENVGGRIPENVQIQLQNVKMIFSNAESFAALLENGRVIVWGEEDSGGKIPDEIQLKLIKQNVEIIFPNERGFTALCNNGELITWGTDFSFFCL